MLPGIIFVSFIILLTKLGDGTAKFPPILLSCLCEEVCTCTNEKKEVTKSLLLLSVGNIHPELYMQMEE